MIFHIVFTFNLFVNRIAAPVYVVGANIQASLSTDEHDKMKEYCHIRLQVDYDKEMSAITLHSRAIVNGTMYHSTLYNSKATKLNNYIVA